MTEFTGRLLTYIHRDVMKWQHKQQTASSATCPPTHPSSLAQHIHVHQTTEIICWHCWYHVSWRFNSSPSSQCCIQQLSCSLHRLLAVVLHSVAQPSDHPAWQIQVTPICSSQFRHMYTNLKYSAVFCPRIIQRFVFLKWPLNFQISKFLLSGVKFSPSQKIITFTQYPFLVFKYVTYKLYEGSWPCGLKITVDIHDILKWMASSYSMSTLPYKYGTITHNRYGKTSSVFLL